RGWYLPRRCAHVARVGGLLSAAPDRSPRRARSARLGQALRDTAALAKLAGRPPAVAGWPGRTATCLSAKFPSPTSASTRDRSRSWLPVKRLPTRADRGRLRGDGREGHVGERTGRPYLLRAVGLAVTPIEDREHADCLV